jgi:phenylpropionate dioxygenase-like ring-hydroxylating dioxygenase large terminal subunit
MNCPFHGWAFALNGDLAGLEGEEYFYDFNREDYALKKVRVGVWEDLIFVNFDPFGTETLEDYLGELIDGFEGYWNPNQWERVTKYRWTLDFNWKLYLDSSVEGYHAAYVHLFNNTGQIASSNPAPLWLPKETVRLYDRHRIVGIPENVGERNLSPVEQFVFRYGSVTGYGHSSREFPKNVNPLRKEDFAFDILELFPNGVFFNSGNLAAIIRLWPVSESRTVCEVEVMLPPAQTWAGRLSQEYGKVALRDVIREDMNTAVGIQQVARPSDEFVLGDQEIAVRHSYHEIDKAITKSLAESNA